MYAIHQHLPEALRTQRKAAIGQ
jgi:hypothetical protein